MLWMLGLFLLLDVFFVIARWAGHKRVPLVYISYLQVSIFPLFPSCSSSSTFFCPLLFLKWMILALTWPMVHDGAFSSDISMNAVIGMCYYLFPWERQISGNLLVSTCFCHVILYRGHGDKQQNNKRYIPKELSHRCCFLVTFPIWTLTSSFLRSKLESTFPSQDVSFPNKCNNWSDLISRIIFSPQFEYYLSFMKNKGFKAPDSLSFE